MKTVVIIPARHDSKRLPGKALADIDGQPMVRHVVTQARKAQGVDSIYVATDHREIHDSITDLCYGVMTSPDCRSGTDRVAQAARLIGLGRDDVVVNVQGDMPFFNPELLTTLIRWFQTYKRAGIGTPAMVEFNGNTRDMVCVVTDSLSNALYFSRHPLETSPGKHLLHMGMYIYMSSSLQAVAMSGTAKCEEAENLEQLRALYHGYDIGVMETGLECGQEINTPEDLEKARGG